MNASQIGAVLRMVGPLIQIAILTLLLKSERVRTVLGLPVDYVIWGGFLLGLSLSALGILLSRRRPSKDGSDPIDRPLDL